MRPHESESQNFLAGVTEDRFFRAAREYARSAFPNSDRVGCLTTERLRLLAEGKTAKAQIGPDAEHVANCSPCFVEYEALRAGLRRRRVVRILVLTAASLIMVAVGVARWWPKPVPAPPMPVLAKPVEHRPPEPEIRIATLDLRPFEATRGVGGPTSRRAVLDRANLRLKLLLPVGSDDGRYFVQLREPSGTVRMQTPATAAILNFVTTLEIVIDLRPFPKGLCTLALRRATESVWKTYAVEVR